MTQLNSFIQTWVTFAVEPCQQFLDDENSNKQLIWMEPHHDSFPVKLIITKFIHTNARFNFTHPQVLHQHITENWNRNMNVQTSNRSTNLRIDNDATRASISFLAFVDVAAFDCDFELFRAREVSFRLTPSYSRKCKEVQGNNCNWAHPQGQTSNQYSSSRSVRSRERCKSVFGIHSNRLFWPTAEAQCRGADSWTLCCIPDARLARQQFCSP